MFTQDENVKELTTKLGTKKDVKELATEYTLPDYLPDIVKLLRVSASASSPAKYINGDSAEYDGSVIYNVTYATGEGEIKNARIKEDFSGVIQFTGAENADICDIRSVAENAVCRLGSPRKLTLKCKAETSLTLFAKAATVPTLGGKLSPEAERTVQYKKEAVDFCGEARAEEKNVPVSEDIEIGVGFPEIAEVVSITLTPDIENIKYDDGMISYSGCIRANIIYEASEMRDDGTKKYVGVTRDIAVSGQAETKSGLIDPVIAYDMDIKDLSFRPQTDDMGVSRVIEADFDYSVFFKIYHRESCMITTDMYSLSYENANESVTLPYRKIGGAKTFNFSFNESAPVDEKEFSEVVTSYATANITDITKKDNRAEITGSIDLLAILGNGVGSYIGKNAVMPFKAETDCRDMSDTFDYEARAVVNDLNVRVGDDKIYADAEVSVSFVTFEKGSAEMIKASSILTDRPVFAVTNADIVLYYPSRGDTLWNIAKKYNTTVERIQNANGIAGSELREGVILIN